MPMKEFTPHQIAAALAGHPGSPWLELRLLMLFQSEVGDRVDSEAVPFRDALAKAA